MKDTTLLKRISIDPKVMLGKPVIKGTRLTVELILEKLAYGETCEDLIAAYPILKKEDIRAAVLYASRAVAAEEIVAA